MLDGLLFGSLWLCVKSEKEIVLNCQLYSLIQTSVLFSLYVGTTLNASEYVPQAYMRRAYLIGFTGSTGTAVVTHDKALLWMDS
jgi:hypothetical protein